MNEESRVCLPFRRACVPFYITENQISRRLGIGFFDGEMLGLSGDNAGIVHLSPPFVCPIYAIFCKSYLIRGSCRQSYIRMAVVRNGLESVAKESSSAGICPDGNVPII